MGHSRNDMASVYRQKVFDAMLRKCTHHVRAWYLGTITLECAEAQAVETVGTGLCSSAGFGSEAWSMDEVATVSDPLFETAAGRFALPIVSVALHATNWLIPMTRAMGRFSTLGERNHNQELTAAML